MIKASLSTHEKGVMGEDRAVKYLSDHGYSIIDRNFRTRSGEIDIIAQKDSYLVFVEVKSLPHGDIDTLASELGKRKQQKIIKTSKYYLQNHRQYKYQYIRFDVLALDVAGLEPVYHIINAFSE
ncbi:MAG: YraN family protein [Treponema sp.]|nr:YraN family protein [Treponema sp.]